MQFILYIYNLHALLSMLRSGLSRTCEVLNTVT